MRRPDDWHPKIPESTPPAPDLDELTYEEFEETDLLGSGGDADVYRAEVHREGDVHLVALKQPRFEGTVHAEAVERFGEEAQTWASLDDHEGVVTVLDWGSDPLPWIALEYMDGGSLRERDLPLELAEGLWVGTRVCRAVRHAHRHGVAHLDLKPGNVLFRETGPDTWDVPKVSDWGLAKLLLEHSESVEGLSPSYAAPEQFDPDEFGSPDDFTDVYQTGALLYELLTGNPPFTGANPEVMRSVLEDEPPAPTERNPDLPPELDEVLLKALAKEKDDRHESILLLRRDLEAVIQSVEDSSEATGSVAGDIEDDGTTGDAAPASDPGEGNDPTGSAAGAPATHEDDHPTGSGSDADTGPPANADAATSAESDPAADSAGPDPQDGTEQGSALDRRTLLKAGAGVGVAAGVGVGGLALLGGSGGGSSPRDGGDGGGGDDGSQVEFGGWFDDVDNFYGTADARGRSEVTVRVGDEGNGGNFAFGPAAVWVSPGTTVVWKWVSDTHNVVPEAVPEDASWKGHEPIENQGYTYEHTFETPGVYTYYCRPHKLVGMKGALVVGETEHAQSGGGTTGGSRSNAVRIGVLQSTGTTLGREALRGFYTGLGVASGTDPVTDLSAGSHTVDAGDRTYEVTVRDLRRVPERAGKLAGDLVQAGADVLFGGTTAIGVADARSVATNNGVPLILGPADVPGLTADADYCARLQFRASANAAMSARAGAGHLTRTARESGGTTGVYLVGLDVTPGREMVDAYGSALGGDHTEVVGEDFVGLQATNPSPFFERATKVGADVVALGIPALASHPLVGTFVRMASNYDVGLLVPMPLQGPGMDALATAVRDALDGPLTPETYRTAGIEPFPTYYASNHHGGAFVDAHVSAHGVTPSQVTAGTATAASAIVQAVRDGGADPGAIAEELRGMTVETTPKGEGAYQFQPYNNQAQSPITLAYPVDADAVDVPGEWPASVAPGDPVFDVDGEYATIPLESELMGCSL